MTEVRMPKPGDAITEAELTEFYVADGDHVSEGDPLYQIATDKVEMDIEAPSSGVVRRPPSPQRWVPSCSRESMWSGGSASAI